MKDRIPTYPGRVKLVPVAGQANVYDMVRADEPVEAGTPLNKATLLTDQTAAKYGKDNTAVPDNIFDVLSKGVLADSVDTKDYAWEYDTWQSFGKSISREIELVFKTSQGSYLMGISGDTGIIRSTSLNSDIITSTTGSTSYYPFGFAEGGGIIASTGTLGGSNYAAKYSLNDGESWVEVTPPQDNTIKLYYHNGYFVVLTDSSLERATPTQFKNGQWQIISDSVASSLISDTSLLICGQTSSILVNSTGDKIAYSTDNCLTWKNATLPTLAGSPTRYMGAYLENKFVLIIKTNAGISIITSLNGSSWTLEAEIEDISALAFPADGVGLVGAYDETSYFFSYRKQTFVKINKTDLSDITVITPLGSDNGSETVLLQPVGEKITVFVQGLGNNNYIEKVIDTKTVLTNVLGEEIKGLLGIVTGSYIGTGAYGQSNPNTLTLSVIPKIVMIQPVLTVDRFVIFQQGATMAYSTNQISNANYLVRVAWEQNKIMFYATNNANTQLNGEGVEYRYLAIGETI